MNPIGFIIAAVLYLLAAASVSIVHWAGHATGPNKPSAAKGGGSIDEYRIDPPTDVESNMYLGGLTPHIVTGGDNIRLETATSPNLPSASAPAGTTTRPVWQTENTVNMHAFLNQIAAIRKQWALKPRIDCVSANSPTVITKNINEKIFFISDPSQLVLLKDNNFSLSFDLPTEHIPNKIVFQSELANPGHAALAFEQSIFNNTTNRLKSLVFKAATGSILIATAVKPAPAHLALVFGPDLHGQATIEYVRADDRPKEGLAINQESAALYHEHSPHIDVAPAGPKHNLASQYDLIYIYTSGDDLGPKTVKSYFSRVKKNGSIIFILDILRPTFAASILKQASGQFGDAFMTFGELGAMTAALVLEKKMSAPRLAFGFPPQLISYINEYADVCAKAFNNSSKSDVDINTFTTSRNNLLHFDDAAACYFYNNQSSMRWCIENDEKLGFNNPMFDVNDYYKYNYMSKDFLIKSRDYINDKSKSAPKVLRPDAWPDLPGVDKTELEFTLDSVFSVTPWPDSAQVIAHIEKYLGPISKLSVVDGTANCGGTALAFAARSVRVLAVEIEADAFAALAHNLKTVYAQHIRADLQLLHADVVEVLKSVRPGTFNVLHLDPPWGGITYKYHKRMRLFLSGVSVAQVITANFDKFDLFALKAPPNFDIENFIDAIRRSGLQINTDIVTVQNYLYIFLKPVPIIKISDKYIDHISYNGGTKTKSY
jgi:predicted RNA methylase